MKKGVTGDQHVAAGQRVRAAGMQLSEYVISGLGGQALSRAHALETAAVLNRINPDFIRLRTLRVPGRVPLYADLQSGTFVMPTDDQIVAEIRLLVERLDGITSTVTSDHFMNLLEEVGGVLPGDQGRMLAAIDRYLDLSDTDRWVFRAGRRGGRYRNLADMTGDQKTYRQIRDLVESVRATKGDDAVDRMIAAMNAPQA
jgi:hypothetical protein